MMLSTRRHILPLCCLVILENASVLLTRYTRTYLSPSSEPLFEISQLVIAIECTKFLLAFVLEWIHTNGNIGTSIWHHFNKEGLVLLLAPAFLYYIHNNLFYVALSHLPSPIFQIVYQGKLLLTAVLSMWHLNRHYSRQQWTCLCVLTIGIAITASSSEEDNEKHTNDDKSSTSDLVIGLVAVFVAASSSSLAGVLFEKYLKADDDPRKTAPLQVHQHQHYLQKPSLYMRNLQLSSISATLALLDRLLLYDDNSTTRPKQAPLLEGFTVWVWILVLIRSTTGLVVAVVIRNCDNVIKGVASGISILVGCLLSQILLSTPVSMQFWLGASLVIPSSFYFSNQNAMPNIWRNKKLTFQVLLLLLLLSQARHYWISEAMTSYEESRLDNTTGQLRGT